MELRIKSKNNKDSVVHYGGNTIQLGLPFDTSKYEIDSLVHALSDTLNEV